MTPELPPVWADEMLLEEIVRNLVENAVRYSPPGHPIEISAQRDTGGVMLAVADHGPGIPEEKQHDIFRSFFRLDQSESAPARLRARALLRGQARASAWAARSGSRARSGRTATRRARRLSFTLPIVRGRAAGGRCRDRPDTDGAATLG